MDESMNVIKIADNVLASIDFNEEFMEHYGVPGMRWGVINEDRSIGRGLSRKHFGFKRKKAYDGYREAYKKKVQEEKIAVKKARIGNNLKKAYKNRSLYSQSEMEQLIKRSESENQLAKSLKTPRELKIQERLQKQERKELAKKEKREFQLAKEEIKSRERIEKAKLQNNIDVQNAKDKGQAEREQAAREYQTQQEIAKGKTLLGRVRTIGGLASSIYSTASNIKKLTDLVGITPHSETLDQVKEATKKVKEQVKKAAPESSIVQKMSDQKDSSEKPKKKNAEKESPKEEQSNVLNTVLGDRFKVEAKNHIINVNSDKYKADHGIDKFKLDANVMKTPITGKMSTNWNTMDILAERSAKRRLEVGEAEAAVERTFNAKRLSGLPKQASSKDFENAVAYREKASKKLKEADEDFMRAMKAVQISSGDAEKISMDNAAGRKKWDGILSNKTVMNTQIDKFETYDSYQTRRLRAIMGSEKKVSADKDISTGRNLLKKFGSEYNDRNVGSTLQREGERRKPLKDAAEKVISSNGDVERERNQLNNVKKNLDYYTSKGDKTNIEKWKQYYDENKKRYDKAISDREKAQKAYSEEYKKGKEAGVNYDHHSVKSVMSKAESLINKRKAEEAAKDRAEQMIENAKEVKAKSSGPLSDTVKFVTSMSVSKLAGILSGNVPNSTPNKINLGSLMRTTIEPQPNYLEGLRKDKNIKHSMEYITDEIFEAIENAGEVENAE